MGFLANKKILIVGLLSNRSIAYGIAQSMYREGAELAFTYYGDRFKERIQKLAGEFSSNIILPCDVSDDQQITELFSELSKQWPNLNGVIHSVGFAPGDQLAGDYLSCVNREGFKIAHDISSYSFSALAKAAAPMLVDQQSALLTLSYLGSQRAVPNYNVMGVAKASLEASVRYLASSLGPRGIRVNAISAGPIKTLAAAGIKDFKKLLNNNAQIVPLRKNTSLKEVGDTAAFLCSELSNGITGEIIHVDSGYHAVDPLQLA